MKFRWSLATPQPALAAELVQKLSVSPLLAQCLVNRGLTTPDSATRFLDPRLKMLADPFLLPDMTAAVHRLFLARERKEAVVIFGDYDVDGITATALLTEVLRALGWMTHYYLPHRLQEGYGLSSSAVENCLQRHSPGLLLAVDCGSTACDTIADLRARNIDVVVLDHHQVCSPAPPANALVNPHRAAADIPSFRELCSAGLAFKLAHALLKHGRQAGVSAAFEIDLRHWLDLVALGTIADLVPLTGENRILVNSGIAHLNHTRRPGILALREVARISRPVGAYEVGFQLGPRLNAAGRVENALAALELLLAPALDQARPLAAQLDLQNRERQELERGIANTLIDSLKPRFDRARDFVIVEGASEWHLGVVGIVASRVLQEFHRPTIILGGDGRHWRGSGRSIPGFDLAAALRECGDLLVRHGGHAMAAGVTVLPENMDALRTRLNDHARAVLRPDDLVPSLALDAHASPSELSFSAVSDLERLRQTGMGNPAPNLLLCNLRQARPPQFVGAEKRHVKLWVTDGQATIEAVWWGGANEPLPSENFDLAATPQIHTYNGLQSLQLKVLDWRKPGSP